MVAKASQNRLAHSLYPSAVSLEIDLVLVCGSSFLFIVVGMRHKRLPIKNEMLSCRDTV